MPVRTDWVARLILGIVLVAVFGKAIAWFVNPKSELQKLLLRCGASVSAAFAARIHLRFFDPLYLEPIS